MNIISEINLEGLAEKVWKNYYLTAKEKIPSLEKTAEPSLAWEAGLKLFGHRAAEVNLNLGYIGPEVQMMHLKISSPSGEEDLKIFYNYAASNKSYETYLIDKKNPQDSEVIMGNRRFPEDCGVLERRLNPYVPDKFMNLDWKVESIDRLNTGDLSKDRRELNSKSTRPNNSYEDAKRTFKKLVLGGIAVALLIYGASYMMKCGYEMQETKEKAVQKPKSKAAYYEEDPCRPGSSIRSQKD